MPLCANAGCVPCEGGATAPSCDNESFTEHCESGRPVTCSDGFVERGIRCADVGLDCQPNSFGDGVGCFGSGSDWQTNWGGDGLPMGIGCSGATLKGCVGERGHDIAGCAPKWGRCTPGPYGEI